MIAVTPPVDAQELLRIGEAASRVGLSVETLRRYTKQGILPFVRTPGNQRLFLVADVDALLTRHGDEA